LRKPAGGGREGSRGRSCQTEDHGGAEDAEAGAVEEEVNGTLECAGI